MPATWNRGIGPFYFNLCEGNLTEECSAGALLTSGDWPQLPVEFPRNLGSVLRHNSFIRNRTNGMIITSRKKRTDGDTSPSVAGAIVEFNVVRDARVAYHVANHADHIVLRRNHAYYWYPVSTSPDPPVAFQFDHPGTYALEDNTVEGIHGTYSRPIIKEKHVYREQQAEEKKTGKK
jgi:hypothetical protein